MADLNFTGKGGGGGDEARRAGMVGAYHLRFRGGGGIEKMLKRSIQNGVFNAF